MCLNRILLTRLLKSFKKKDLFIYPEEERGSHVKFCKPGNPTLTVIVPASGKEIPFGTFKSILRQAQLTEKDFG